MNLSSGEIENIKYLNPLSAVIGQIVILMKKGQEYEGLCPFHGEKTPSFTINDEKAFYHCFGCGAHGDVIGFLQNYHNEDFQTAVRRLGGDDFTVSTRVYRQDQGRPCRP